MSQKPTKRRQSVAVRPVTFSSFGRSVAYIASAYMVKRQKLATKLHRSAPNVFGNECNEHSLREKAKQSSEEEEFDGVIQADFALFDPKPDDFHGVKVLLQSYLDNKQRDLSGFVDLILGQTTDHKSILEIKEFLIKVYQDRNVIDDLRLLLGEQAHDVGLIISQRVVNLPPQLLPPLYDALFDEISWATEDEPTAELRRSFCFKCYLMVTKIYKQRNGDQKKRQSSDNEEALIYIKPEDEIFLKLCSWSFCFPLNSGHVTTHELRNYRLMGLVIAIQADKASKFQEELRSLIDES